MSMNDLQWPMIGVILLAAIVAAVGGAVVIWGPSGALSFQEYIDTLWKFAVAIGIVGVGGGIKSGLENHGAAGTQLDDAGLLDDIRSLVAGHDGGGTMPPPAPAPEPAPVPAPPPEPGDQHV